MAIPIPPLLTSFQSSLSPYKPTISSLLLAISMPNLTNFVQIPSTHALFSPTPLSQICRRFPTRSVPVTHPLSAIQRHERYFSRSILCPLSVPGCQCQPLFLKIKIVCCVLFLITKALHKTVCIDRLTKSLKPTKALFKLLHFQAKHTI